MNNEKLKQFVDLGDKNEELVIFLKNKLGLSEEKALLAIRVWKVLY